MGSAETVRVFDSLLASGRTLALAESCTGGRAGAELTSIPGASKIFMGSLVTYANAAKIRILNVPEKLLEKKGAVSAEVAIAMAHGARKQFAADVAAAVTGVAGPEGGTVTRPVGTVWLAFVDDRREEALSEHFEGDRDAIQSAATRCLFRYLALFLDNNSQNT